MKRLMMTILILVALLYVCATTQPMCPSQDIVIKSDSGYVYIPEGYLVPENYMTMEQFEELVREYQRKLREGEMRRKGI